MTLYVGWLVGSLVGCFGLNGPLRQHFSLYRAFSQRGRKKREMIDESKNGALISSVTALLHTKIMTPNIQEYLSLMLSATGFRDKYSFHHKWNNI